jgi:hypothetical protein
LENGKEVFSKAQTRSLSRIPDSSFPNNYLASKIIEKVLIFRIQAENLGDINHLYRFSLICAEAIRNFFFYVAKAEALSIKNPSDKADGKSCFSKLA